MRANHDIRQCFWVSLSPSTPPNKNGLPFRINRSIWPTTMSCKYIKNFSELCDLVLQIICVQITLVNDLMIRRALPPATPIILFFLLVGYHGENIYIFLPEYEKEVGWENIQKTLRKVGWGGVGEGSGGEESRYPGAHMGNI